VKLRTYELGKLLANVLQRFGNVIYWTASVTAVVCLLFGVFVWVTATASGMTTDEATLIASSFIAAALIWLAARWVADKAAAEQEAKRFAREEQDKLDSQ
jgi:hypothetical protein